MLPTTTRRALLLGAIGLGAVATLRSVAQPAERVVRIVATRFVFTPAQIELRRGEPVRLELTSADVPMGFNAHELGLRSDLMPGQIATLRFTPTQAGTFEFHCDVFCGTGHEDMSGTIVVSG